MEINKGKVKNISKKVLSGALVFSLVMIPSTGCTASEKNEFEYIVNEQGEYEVSGTVDYQTLKNYCFTVIENPSYNKTEFYICEEVIGYQRYQGHYYTYNNVFNDTEVFCTRVEANRTLVYKIKLDEYLFAYDMIKSEYTKEDVEKILEQMKEEYTKQNNKELVK